MLTYILHAPGGSINLFTVFGIILLIITLPISVPYNGTGYSMPMPFSLTLPVSSYSSQRQFPKTFFIDNLNPSPGNLHNPLACKVFQRP